MKQKFLGGYNDNGNRMEREDAIFRQGRISMIASIIAAVAAVGSLIIPILK